MDSNQIVIPLQPSQSSVLHTAGYRIARTHAMERKYNIRLALPFLPFDKLFKEI